MSDLLARLQAALADRYAIERELGRGGMAFVFLASDLKHRRAVAIKVLRPEIAAALGPERFLREIGIAARLTHPHILPLHDSGEADGLLYYVMPYVEGESLRDRLNREPQLPVEDALHIARDAAGALDHAHRHNVVHRDIKPENILLAGDQAMVADFGIARAITAAAGEQLTRTGIAVGTPAYMSPEQAVGATPLDARTDIYSLGCVVYEMLTGAPPNLAQRLTDPLPPVRTIRWAVPEPVDRAIGRALAPRLAERFATAAEFAAALGPATDAPRFAGQRVWRTLAYVGAVVLLAGIGFGLATGAFSRVSRSAALRSIAVLPFANHSADPENQYFADGMTEELIGVLAKVPGLRVAPRASAFALKDKREDDRTVGRLLGVAAVLSGSVRRSGNDLRVTARLTSAADGFVLWSETYQRTPRDVFAVQDEISRAIVGALAIALAAPSPAHRGTPDLVAHDLYLRGRYFFNQQTRSSLEQSIALFEQAVARDSAYAEPYVGIADAYFWLVDDFVPPHVAYARARAAVRRALALDDGSAAAHTLNATIALWYDRDSATAAREFARALALDPNDPTAHYYYSFSLWSRGGEAVLAEQRRAQELDPLNAVLGGEIAGTLTELGRLDDAIAVARQALALDPDQFLALLNLGDAYRARRMYPEAVGAYERARRLRWGRGSAGLALAYAAWGKPTNARGIAREMAARARHEYVSPILIAQAHAVVDDADAAFRWIEQAIDARSGWLVLLRADPAFDPIRSDPRFQQVLARVRP